MNRLFANGTVHAMQSGKGPFLFLLHSLLSDRASFDAVVPRLSQSFRVVVPELPGFGGSQAVDGGLSAVADRMAEALTDAAGGDIPTSPPNSFSPIAVLRSRKKAGKPFAIWPRHPRPGDCPLSPTLRCAGCLRRNFRPGIPT